MTDRPYWHGCNYPWSFDGTTAFYGLDFGANVWGSHLGVSTRRDAVARDFAEMARLGFTVTRWFLFCDGRSGIVTTNAGSPRSRRADFHDLDPRWRSRCRQASECRRPLDHRGLQGWPARSWIR